MPRLYGDGMRYDVIVSFSGIEHDGLGVYGDPMNPWADVAAMQEMWLLLNPGGLLVLGVPVNRDDNVILRRKDSLRSDGSSPPHGAWRDRVCGSLRPGWPSLQSALVV
eukprot:736344-Prymnesium_polylepis.2